MENLIYVSGWFLWVMVISYVLLRLFLGKNWFYKLGLYSIVGTSLVNSIKKLFNEYPHEIKKDTLSEVTANIIRRFTRIGLVGLLFAIIPIWLLVNQNEILEIQNDKIDLQNTKITEQTYLIEAERRSALMLLFSDIITDLNLEIEKRGVTNSPLSNGLTGRIISLSRSFKPYYYLDGDNLTTSLRSPERGQLLLTLLNSKIDTQSYIKLFEECDFSYAELTGYKIIGKFMPGVNLQNSYLDQTVFDGSNMIGADLSNSTSKNSSYKDTDLTLSNLIGTDFTSSNLQNINISACNATNAVFDSCQIQNAILKSVLFQNSSLVAANLSNAVFYREWNPIIICPHDWSQERSNFIEVDQKIADYPIIKIDNRGYYDAKVPEPYLYLHETIFFNAKLNTANLKSVDLHQVQFINCNLDSTNFTGTNLLDTKFLNSPSTGSDLYFSLLGNDALAWVIENDIHFDNVLAILEEDDFVEKLENTLRYKNGVKLPETLKYIQDSTNYYILPNEEYCFTFRKAENVFKEPGNLRYHPSHIAKQYFPGMSEKRDSIYNRLKSCELMDDVIDENGLYKYLFLRYQIDIRKSPLYHIKSRRTMSNNLACNNKLTLIKLPGLDRKIWNDRGVGVNRYKYYITDSIKLLHEYY